MAYATAATWSPTSLQLRFAFSHRNCRGSPPILARARVKQLELRRVRVFCVAQDGAERRRTGGEWIGADSAAADTFAGWSGSGNGDEESIEEQRKKLSLGIVGTGVTGAILVTGLIFAAFSLSRQSNSKSNLYMGPLTSQQEVSFTEVEEDMNEGNEKHNDATMELERGMAKDLSSSPEFNEVTSENKIGNDNETLSVDDFKYSPDGSDAINNVSLQEDWKQESSFDDMSVAPETTPSMINLHESEILGGSLDTSSLEPTSEIGKNLVNGKPTNLSTEAIFNSDHPEGLPDSNGAGNSNLSLDSSSNFTAHATTEPLVSSWSDSDTILEPQIVPKDGMETVASPSIKENFDLSMTPQISAERNSSSLEEHNLNESGYSRTTFVTTSASQFANKEETNGHNGTNRERAFFESPTPASSFSSAGIPAPSLVSAALQVLPGKVLVPAVVDQVQGQALAALQVLKVIEADVQASDLCTRREYARWLVAASSLLSRNTLSKVYPAMYIENVTELAFDDVTPEDPDFPSIQGLAEAGLISSKLSSQDLLSSSDRHQGPFHFSPESPLSRQDLVSWKMALEKRQLPEADRKILYEISGFIDIDKINPAAWPALVADLSSGEHGIVGLAFGCTRLFQPGKPVTKAQAAVTLATGEASDMVNEELARIEAESMAENAVSAHNALVEQVEKDINASFEKELSVEREKIDAVEKMAEEARRELERLRAEREEDNIALMKERAAVEAEMEVLSRLRSEVEEQLQNLMSNKLEISYEKERLSILRQAAENDSQEIARLQYELEVERKALATARAWAEDEAKRVREQAKAIEDARAQWKGSGIKVVVEDDLSEQSTPTLTWVRARKESFVEETVRRAENLVDKLKVMADDVQGKSRERINDVIQNIASLVSVLKEWASKAGSQAIELKDASILKAMESIEELQKSTAEFGLVVKGSAKRVMGDCRDGVEKLTQKFKA